MRWISEYAPYHATRAWRRGADPYSERVAGVMLLAAFVYSASVADTPWWTATKAVGKLDISFKISLWWSDGTVLAQNGKVDLGGACTSSDECVAGSTCVVEALRCYATFNCTEGDGCTSMSRTSGMILTAGEACDEERQCLLFLFLLRVFCVLTPALCLIAAVLFWRGGRSRLATGLSWASTGFGALSLLSAILMHLPDAEIENTLYAGFLWNSIATALVILSSASAATSEYDRRKTMARRRMASEPSASTAPSTGCGAGVPESETSQGMVVRDNSGANAASSKTCSSAAPPSPLVSQTGAPASSSEATGGGNNNDVNNSNTNNDNKNTTTTTATNNNTNNNNNNNNNNSCPSPGAGTSEEVLDVGNDESRRCPPLHMLDESSFFWDIQQEKPVSLMLPRIDSMLPLSPRYNAAPIPHPSPSGLPTPPPPPPLPSTPPGSPTAPVEEEASKLSPAPIDTEHTTAAPRIRDSAKAGT